MRAKMTLLILCSIIFFNFNCIDVLADVKRVKIDGKKVKEIEIFIDIEKNEVFMNNRNLKYKGNPIIIQNNEAYFPMRGMSRMLQLYNGPAVVWDDKTKTCSISLFAEKPYFLSIPMDSNIYYEWGQEKYTDKKACLINGNAYIPLSLLQNIYHIPDEGIILDLPNKTIEITRSFDFETDKISIIENKFNPEERKFKIRKVDITDQKLINEISDGLYEGFHESSHTYALAYTMWLDFNNGTIMGVISPTSDGKYMFDYCSLSVGIDEIPGNAVELSDNARVTLEKIFKECNATGF